MIIFAARERGLLTHCSPWKGRIVSVYERALNIRRPDGLLISLVASREQMSALSVQVPRLFEPRLFGPSKRQLPAGLAAGGCAGYDGRCLTAGACSVTLEGSPWFDSALRLAPGTCPPKPRRTALRRSLLTRGRGGGLLSVMTPEAADNAFARHAKKILRDAASGGPRLTGLDRLVGLGIGFTPSGDDFLAGLLLGEAMAGQTARLFLDRTGFAAALVKTNDGGRSLLYQVLEGHFPYYLIETAAGLVSARNAEAVDAAVARAVRHGETSGTDTLAGLLWYLEAAAGLPEGRQANMG